MYGARHNPWNWSATDWGKYIAYEDLTNDLILDEDVITDFSLADQDKLDFSGLANLTEDQFLLELSAANLAYNHAITNNVVTNEQFNITFIDPDKDGFGDIRIEYNVNGNGWDVAANVFDAAVILENQDLSLWTIDNVDNIALFSA